MSLAIPPVIEVPYTVVAATEQPQVSIDNFGRVNASYYRGGEPEADDYAALSALGIRT